MDDSIMIAMFINLSYSLLGGIVAIFLMIMAYLLIDQFTPYDTGNELDNNNISVAVVVSSIFISIAIVLGLIMGFSLN